MSNQETKPYGKGDSSFRAAGGESGVKRLTEDFYQAMQELPQARQILDMHKDVGDSTEKLALFLNAWLGGPIPDREHWKNTPLPLSHKHLAIGPKERDAWMDCMRAAVEKQDWESSFKEYFLTQIYKPARILRNRDE